MSKPVAFPFSPTPQVTWKRRGGRDMPANHEIKDEGMELVLNRVDWADAGTYRCEAVTPNMPSMTPVHQDFELTVECKYRPIPIFRDLFSNTNLYI